MSGPDVALIAPYPPAGERHAGFSGVASYAANLAHALSGEGARVAVIAPEQEGEARAGRDGPVWVERSFRRGARALPAAARAARETGAPVVHLQHELFLYGGPSSVPGLVPALASLRAGGAAPVATMHQVVEAAAVDRSFTRLHRVRTPALVARAGIGGIQGAIRRLARRVIVHEPSFARLVPDAVVVPHGVEAAAPARRDQARAELGIEGDRLTVLCFGFIAPYKGLEAALDAAELAGDSVQIVVAGGDHPRLAAAGERYADELRERYGPVARFTGRVPEQQVAAWFGAADLALFAYPRPFSSSGALALAIAYETPFLLSPQLAEAIGAPRAVSAPLGRDALAAYLRELATSRGLLQELRTSCRGFGSGRSWPAVARRHIELYEEVIDAHRTAGRRLRAA